MISESISGKTWQTGQLTSWIGAVTTGTYGSRSCITLAGGQTVATLYRQWATESALWRNATLSSATDPVAVHQRIELAPETLNAADPSTTTIYKRQFCSSTYGGSPFENITLDVVRSGATYTLKGNGVTLKTITAGTTFTLVDMYTFLDKTIYYVDGVKVVAEYTYSTPLTASYCNIWYLYWYDTVKWHLNYFWCQVEDVDFTGVLAKSYTNRAPDTGTLLFISKADLQTLKTAGTLFQVAITDGAFTEAVTHPGGDTDYLVVKILSSQLAGRVMTIESDGDWEDGTWSDLT